MYVNRIQVYIHHIILVSDSMSVSVSAKSQAFIVPVQSDEACRNQPQQFYFFSMYFGYSFHLEPENPSIHYKSKIYAFVEKLQPLQYVSFMQHIYFKKKRPVNQFWLIGTPHDTVAIDLSKITQNINMQKFPHSFIYPAVIFALECMLNH